MDRAHLPKILRKARTHGLFVCGDSPTRAPGHFELLHRLDRLHLGEREEAGRRLSVPGERIMQVFSNITAPYELEFEEIECRITSEAQCAEVGTPRHRGKPAKSA